MLHASWLMNNGRLTLNALRYTKYMYDLISIGNISIDLYYRDNSLTFQHGRFQLVLGGKYFTNYFYSGVGGGGANVAIGAQKNGLKAAVLGKIGNNPFKELIISSLKNDDVTTYLCQLEENYLNISTILLTKNGERTIINFESPHQHIIKNERELLKLEKTRAVYFGNLPDVSLSERIKLLFFFKKRSIPIFANMGVKDCRRPISQLANFITKLDTLILNGHEFADLVKKKFNDISFNKDVTDDLPILKKLTLVITLDKKGSYTYHNGQVLHEPAPSVTRIVDSTGAGDGFTAGYISAYLKTQSLAKAPKAGSAYAGEILKRVGAN